jgi:hypothetical protein
MPQRVSKRYVLQTLVEKAARATTPVQDVLLSPKAYDEKREAAISYFRGARNANDRYAAYKQVEARKQKEIRAKSLPTQETALGRLKAATKKLQMVGALSKPTASNAKVVGGLGGGNIGQVTNLKERLQLLKQDSELKKAKAAAGRSP